MEGSFRAPTSEIQEQQRLRTLMSEDDLEANPMSPRSTKIESMMTVWRVRSFWITVLLVTVNLAIGVICTAMDAILFNMIAFMILADQVVYLTYYFMVKKGLGEPIHTRV